jgi:integrase
VIGTLRACFSTAVREGLIRHNPARDAALPHRPTEADLEQDEVRALTREQLAAILGSVHPRHRVMFRFLAATGLRWSELVALQWRHLQLDGSRAHVKVRRGLVRGDLGPPKSRHARRDVPLDAVLVRELRRHRDGSEWAGDEDLVFPSQPGTPLGQLEYALAAAAPDR